MIQIEGVSIQKFRGIKQLSLTLNRANFGISGNNGTGKSGVVDAIEFALTGGITRLTGKGTAGLSIRTHGPHVDFASVPKDAKVVIDVHFPSLNKSISIGRSIANPKTPELSEQSAELNALIERFIEHPEFALSRREILKYVLTEPGERSKSVQALMKLDDVEKTRATLQTIANQCKTEQTKAKLDVDSAKSNLLRALQLEELKVDSILKVANERRVVLGLDVLTALDKETSLREGLDGGATPPKIAFNKAGVVAAFKKIADDAAAPTGPTETEHIKTALECYKKIDAEPELLANLKQKEFFKTGFELIDSEICPLCSTKWEIEELRTIVKAKLESAKSATALKQKLDTARLGLKHAGETLVQSVNAAIATARKQFPDQDIASLENWSASLKADLQQLDAYDKCPENTAFLKNGWRTIPAAAAYTLEELRKKADALPEESKTDKARDFLTVSQERLEVYRKAKRTEEMWNQRCTLSGKIVAHFLKSSEGVLNNVYDEVEKDFIHFYRQINQDDEDQFTAKLTVATGKLGFDVDFYGRGHVPPGAYHSEGHQDGMGLCLYLALMRRTLGVNFTFAVLDDVLMSVDAGHRKEVCKLLKSEFPNTQFIFTTHDQVWLQHMITEGLLTNKSVVQFRKWTVDDGPAVWNHQDAWSEIQKDLDEGNVPAASATLRRYLEFFAGEMSSRLKAQVEYRSNASYDLGELLPNVTSAYVKHLGSAKNCAQAWKDTDGFAKISLVQDSFKEKLQRTKVEEWAINKTVHYNEWASLHANDFSPLVAAFRDLTAAFQCEKCKCLVHLTPPRGTPELLRCDCMATQYNLKKP